MDGAQAVVRTTAKSESVQAANPISKFTDNYTPHQGPRDSEISSYDFEPLEADDNMIMGSERYSSIQLAATARTVQYESATLAFLQLYVYMCTNMSLVSHEACSTVPATLAS